MVSLFYYIYNQRYYYYYYYVHFFAPVDKDRKCAKSNSHLSNKNVLSSFLNEFLLWDKQGHILYIHDLWGQVIYSSFSEIPDLRNVKIDTTINYGIILTSLVMNGQVEGSLTFNFKVIRQCHVICSNILNSTTSIMLKTTPTLLLYHIYIKRYVDLQTMVKTVHFDHRHGQLTSWHMSRDSVKMMSHMSKCVFHP